MVQRFETFAMQDYVENLKRLLPQNRFRTSDKFFVLPGYTVENVFQYPNGFESYYHEA